MSSFLSSNEMIQLYHLTDLPGANEALKTLERIRQEFAPIINRRGYHVTKLSEMCCCGDGMDMPLAHQRSIREDNIGGYNQTKTRGHGKIHEIHLRLRESRQHAMFIPYQDVVNTMAHELAHCVHSPHNTDFYQLMDDILDQHATYMMNGQILDSDGFPMNSLDAHVLGGRPRSAVASSHQQRLQVEALRAARLQKGQIYVRPQRLGGGANANLTAREAAALAAEARRRQDDLWCHPPFQHNDEAEEDDDKKKDAVDGRKVNSNVLEKEPKNKREGRDTDPQKTGEHDDVTDVELFPKQLPWPDQTICTESNDAFKTAIDDKDWECWLCTCQNPAGTRECMACGTAHQWQCHLCTCRNDPEQLECKACGIPRGREVATQEISDVTDLVLEDEEFWDCPQCTFCNKSFFLACGACGTERHESHAIVQKVLRAEEIDRIKKTEVEKSMQDFGFNIYKSGC